MEQKNAILPNTGRQFELDFAKFIAIVFMILVHCFDYSSIYLSSLFAPTAEPTSPLGTLIEFLGAQPAAPVFMFCMGIGLVYTRHNSPRDFTRRGLKLFITGYLLNLYRTTFVVVGGMTGALGEHPLLPLVWAFALCVDILPFAGLAFLFFALMKRLKISPTITTIVVLLLLVVANILPKVGSSEEWYCYIAGLLWYQNDFTSFPLFQWLPFPMAGILFGRQLKATTNKQRFYLLTLVIGVIVFALTTLLACSRSIDLRTFFTTDYFNMNLHSASWSLAIVLILLPTYYFLVNRLHEGPLYQLATFCSRNINKIYLWQWILITPIAALSLTVLPIDAYWKLLVEVVVVCVACLLIVRATTP